MPYERFHFPAWTNSLTRLLPIFGGFAGLYAVTILALGASPDTTDVGYAPQQPVPFSHKLHAGQLKLDCRYCHTTVEEAAHAAIPPTQTCNNCHNPADANGSVATVSVHPNSEKLLTVFESQSSGDPIKWERVHDLPDYACFNHSAHVTRGVSCVSCHGRVDQMEVVQQVEPLSMAWCLDCHREPAPHLRPLDRIAQLDWVPEEALEVIGARVQGELGLNPSTNCSTCHR